jgi:hypothetical protein
MYKVTLTKEQAEKLLIEGWGLREVSDVDYLQDHCDYTFHDDDDVFDNGLAIFRGGIHYLCDGYPDHQASLKNKNVYYTNCSEFFEGQEEEFLDGLLLAEMQKPTNALENLDHEVRIKDDGLYVGCQYISKEDAKEIGEYLVRIFG